MATKKVMNECLVWSGLGTQNQKTKLFLLEGKKTLDTKFQKRTIQNNHKIKGDTIGCVKSQNVEITSHPEKEICRLDYISYGFDHELNEIFTGHHVRGRKYYISTLSTFCLLFSGQIKRLRSINKVILPKSVKSHFPLTAMLWLSVTFYIFFITNESKVDRDSHGMLVN